MSIKLGGHFCYYDTIQFRNQIPFRLFTVPLCTIEPNEHYFAFDPLTPACRFCRIVRVSKCFQSSVWTYEKHVLSVTDCWYKNRWYRQGSGFKINCNEWFVTTFLLEFIIFNISLEQNNRKTFSVFIYERFRSLEH